MKKRLLVLLSLICIVVLMLPLAVSAEEVPYTGWYKNWDGRWSYRQNGAWVMDEVIKIGNEYYGFDDEGYMYESEEFWYNGDYYRAKADGTLHVYEWYQDTAGDWYFYAEAGKAAYDFLKIGTNWYFFTWGGRQASSEYVWSDQYQGYFAISKAGTSSVWLVDGWNKAFGDWYYVYRNQYNDQQVASDETIEDAGFRYRFDYDGKMMTNQIFWDGRYYLATADGKILKTGWAQINGNWYYAKDYVLAEYGTYTIDGFNYYFQNNKLYTIPGELDMEYEYYVGAGGALLKNQWRKDTTGEPDCVGWAYYDADSRKVKSQTIEIDGIWYYFNYAGIMQTNTVRDTLEGVFVFGNDGAGRKVTGWFQHPENQEWMYAENGDLASGIKTIGADTYAFSSGYMVTEEYYYAGDDTYKLFNKEGKMVTRVGFISMGGNWYYVENSEGKLADGWKAISNVWYYFWPEMRANTVFYDHKYETYYAANNDGACTELTGSGWRDLSWGRIYLVAGRPVSEDWMCIGGAWYYFQESGAAVTRGSYVVDEKRYLFDEDGKMATNGWYKFNSSTYYVDAAGEVATGLKTIGGKQYLFDSYGGLYNAGVSYYEGNYYWLDADGSVLTKVKAGWNEVGGKWYYMENGQILRNCLRTIDGIRYGFGSDGAMCTGGIRYAWYDYYMFDASGKLLTGWQNFGGKWYYANPDSSDPLIYSDGVYYIDGEEYLFKDGCLFVGSTMMWGDYYITDGNGIVISCTSVQDGWNYTGDGYIYLKDGEYYTGWVDDYYVEGGHMLVNTTVEYAGKYYYLRADGTYLKSGWYQLPYGDYIYAKSGGALCCSEWLKLDGKYYYFYDINMLSDGIWYIDGQYQEFNAEGIWLGQIDLDEGTNDTTRSDGWHKIGGKWYYYHAGVRQYGNRYINGSWYHFGYDDGAMVTNNFDYYGEYYYGSDGLRANYTGWKLISGNWVYFNADHSVHYGWVKSGAGWYYTDYIYDEDIEAEFAAMVTSEVLIMNGKLYYFDASGYCAGAATGSGWRTYLGQWYYLENGFAVVDNFRQIGNDFYYFDYAGRMLVNDIGYIETFAGYGEAYFGADGKIVRTVGWKETEFGWIYIGANGFLYNHGIYKIGGVDYSFYGCYWVQ